MLTTPQPSLEPGYARALDQLADAALALPPRALRIVALDGLPASGKSTLARGLQQAIEARGRSCAVVENDWFIAPAIRSPLAIAQGLATALAPIGADRIERRLLARFLDGARLEAFLAELERAEAALAQGEPFTLRLEGAFWNLRRPRRWEEHPAAAGIPLAPGAVLVIEGTLTRAVYLPRLPELTTVIVRAPIPTARARFLRRNREPHLQRNLAFTALALNTLAFRLAAGLLERHREAYDAELDLTCFEAPRLRLRASMDLQGRRAESP